MPERDAPTHLRHAFHHAALQRVLVDESFLNRADGEHWRRA